VERKLDQLFPRDLYGHIALALASLCFGPVCWAMAIALLFGSRPGGVPDRLFLTVVEELVVALSLFFACGLVWALATPRRLERLFGAVAKNLAVALGLLALPLGILGAWALIVG
jgi:hypothetical protein